MTSPSQWREFFNRLQDYEVKFRYFECDRNVTAEQLYQAFRARFLAELSEAADYMGNEDLAVVVQHMTSPPTPSAESGDE